MHARAAHALKNPVSWLNAQKTLNYNIFILVGEMKAGPSRTQKRGAFPSAHLHPHADTPLSGVSAHHKITGEKWQNGIHPTEKEGEAIHQSP